MRGQVPAWLGWRSHTRKGPGLAAGWVGLGAGPPVGLGRVARPLGWPRPVSEAGERLPALPGSQGHLGKDGQ